MQFAERPSQGGHFARCFMHFAMQRLSNEGIVSQFSVIKIFLLLVFYLFPPTSSSLALIPRSNLFIHSRKFVSANSLFNGACQFDDRVSKLFFRFSVFFFQPVFEVAEWEKV
jgi:hypothetical protein